MTTSEQKRLFVCGLSAVQDTVDETVAGALVSVLHPELIPETPERIASDQHFKLAIDDIEAPHNGLAHAEADHIVDLCHFARQWHTSDPYPGTLVVHCYAGISRSTAAAFVILCALNPDMSELAIARYLRQQSTTAIPNRLIVGLGDEVLSRKGRMSKAIRTIGSGSCTDTARPFALQANLYDGQKGRLFGPKAA